LTNFEEIIVAGFTSHRRAIVNVTISFWNDLVQENEELPECPDSILNVVKKLSTKASVRLPFGVNLDDHEPVSPHIFSSDASANQTATIE
jgi:hypothetical protein